MADLSERLVQTSSVELEAVLAAVVRLRCNKRPQRLLDYLVGERE
jgi:hypothetical protein